MYRGILGPGLFLRDPMNRIHFLEISDELWCPCGIRRGVTDF
jgi:hypothetical protein